MTDQRRRVAEYTEELRDGPAPSDRSIGEIVEALRPQVQELVDRQVTLAKAELTPVARQAGIATGLIVAGSIFLLLFAVFITLTAIYVLALFLPQWLAALIVSAVLLIIGGVLAGSGAGILRGLDPKPEHTVRALQQNVNWIKGQFRS